MMMNLVLTIFFFIWFFFSPKSTIHFEEGYTTSNFAKIDYKMRIESENFLVRVRISLSQYYYDLWQTSPLNPTFQKPREKKPTKEV